jgi:hypothetical protein
MKINTLKAAGSLGLHPAHFLMHVAEINPKLRFEEIWPEVELSWVKEIVKVTEHRFIQSLDNPEDRHLTDSVEESRSETRSEGQYSSEAIQVINKLYRKDKWGKVSVSIEALKNLTRYSEQQINKIITEIRKKGLLDPDHDGTEGKHTIGLCCARRNDIEKLIQLSKGCS